MSIFDYFKLDGRVAIVTGGSAGIGRAIALAFADAGADVAIVARSQAPRDKICAEIEARGRKALPIAADVGEDSAPARIVAETLARFGRLDILVNNVGGLGDLDKTVEPTMKLSLESWRSIVDVNLTSVFRVSQAAVPALGEGGVILNISSIRATQPFGGSAPYGAAKAGVNSLTREMAMALAPRIRVNALSPGPIPTDTFKNAWGDSPEMRMKMEDAWAMPLRRLGEPDDIATAALFLASPASSWMTGQTLVVSGGLQ